MKIGKKIKKTTLQLSNGEKVNLSDFLGQTLVLYFYPKDNTPGCTQESKDFAVHHDAFAKHNAVVLGVSRDSIASHEKFKTKFCFPFELISDPDEALCEYFEVMKMKNMYGKQYRGIERSTFVIDENGKLAHEWRKVKVPGHVEEVLNTVAKM